MRIGEVARVAGVSTKTLRFYEAAGLLRPPERTPSGYRDYHPGVLGRLDFVRRGRAAGLTLAQIKEVCDVRDGGNPPCAHVSDLLKARLDRIDRQIADLHALRATLMTLSEQAVAGDPSTCTPEQICRYL